MGRIWAWEKMNNQFLRGFVKLRKAAISFIMFLRPSAWKKSAPTGRIINEIWYSSIFRKYVKKIQVSLKSDKRNAYST